MSSMRESLRMESRDYSLLAVAAMFVIFGLAVSNSVIPNYHEQQSLEKRKTELQRKVETAKAENSRIADEIEALDDPYYMADWLRNKLGYRDAPAQVDARPAGDARGN